MAANGNTHRDALGALFGRPDRRRVCVGHERKPWLGIDAPANAAVNLGDKPGLTLYVP